MTFNLVLVGIGGEGLLTVSNIIAKAANYEGYSVRGTQIHGLAQRGGSISVCLRFGSENDTLSSEILPANADLVLAFEPLEAGNAIYHSSKEKTKMIINNCPQIPIYSNLLDIPYPSIDLVSEKINPFVKQIFVFNTKDIAKKEFGAGILGNMILLGIAVGVGALPLKEESIRNAITESFPRNLEKNLQAFARGTELGKKNI